MNIDKNTLEYMERVSELMARKAYANMTGTQAELTTFEAKLVEREFDKLITSLDT